MNSQDVSIKDETNDNYVEVDSSNRLKTATQISDGTNFVTVTGNKLDVNASMTWSNSNKVDIWDGTDDLQINTDGSLNIGDIIPGTGATKLGKAEDAAHTSGDVGVMSLAVRNDGGTALAGTDLDYIPLSTDSSGNLRVTASGSKTYWQTCVEAGRGYMVTTDLITVSGTSEVPFLLLRNPAGSGKTIRIWKISYLLIATITSDSGTFKLYRDATVTTNGTTKTPVKMIKSQANASVFLAGTGPTVSANGTLLMVAATTSGGAYNVDTQDLGMHIQAGENMYFTIKPAVTGKGHAITVFYEEE